MNVNQCCVFNCVATDKSTLFKAPPELFEKWKEALTGKTRTGFYTENDSVCDKHFVVGKVDRALGKDQFGNVICYTLAQPKLDHSAIPTKFDNYESSDQEYLSAMKEAEKKRTSFQKIFDRSNYIHYPDSSWATHKITTPEKMLVSVQVKTRYLNECLLAPYIYKQITFRQGEVQIVILGKIIQLMTSPPEILKDFDDIVNVVHNLKICNGISIDENVLLMSQEFYQDVSSSWRHVSCELIINRGNLCNYCKKFYPAKQKNGKNVVPNNIPNNMPNS